VDSKVGPTLEGTACRRVRVVKAKPHIFLTFALHRGMGCPVAIL
jgi:hypothetical protein